MGCIENGNHQKKMSYKADYINMRMSLLLGGNWYELSNESAPLW